jgi:hypothetical protein
MGCGCERYIVCIEDLVGMVGLCWHDLYMYAEEDDGERVHAEPLQPACHNLVGVME